MRAGRGMINSDCSRSRLALAPSTSASRAMACLAGDGECGLSAPRYTRRDVMRCDAPAMPECSLQSWALRDSTRMQGLLSFLPRSVCFERPPRSELVRAWRLLQRKAALGIAHESRTRRRRSSLELTAEAASHYDTACMRLPWQCISRDSFPHTAAHLRTRGREKRQSSHSHSATCACQPCLY